jgi:hypothetical protein
MARVQGQVRFEAQECGERRIEFSSTQRAEYGAAMRALRSTYGLTDGLRLKRPEFSDYLERRRAADAQARGWS